MAQYRVYLSDTEDRALRSLAQRAGQRPQDAMRGLVQQLAREEKIEALDQHLRRLTAHAEALYTLVAMVAGEVGFTAGAIRFSAQSNEPMTRLATAQKEGLCRAAETLKGAIDRGALGRASGVLATP